MAKRGRPKKLPVVRRLEGNRSRTPIVETTLIPKGAPFIPDHLPEDAQACVELIKASMPPQVYATIDGFILSDFGTWWAWHKAAVHEMSSPDFKPVVAGSMGQAQVNPWFKILSMASQRMQALGERLGLDPKARMSIHVPEDRPVSKFDGLIGRSGSSLLLGSSESRQA